MNKIKVILYSILALTLSIITVIFISTSNVYYGAKEGFQVYLEGKKIGFIKSKDELEEYIDKEQQAIKDKYMVDHVYIPNGLEIKKEITYSENIDTAEAIYEIIKESKDFTIDGYVVTIKGEEGIKSDEDNVSNEAITHTLYILDKNILHTAINATVISFVDEEKYTNYLNENQQEIKDEGTIIENVYVKEEITIKKDRIPVNQQIFQTDRQLAKYLLFRTTKDQETYLVKDGDTIESIATKNKLNVQEFLIANQDIASKDALLYTGEKVVISLIDPIITIVEETHNVAYETITYQTKTEVDTSLFIGEAKIARQGENGTSLVTKKIRKENGQITKAIIVSTEVIKPTVDRIIKKGSFGTNKFWGWPTKSNYTLTDGYGYRWGKLHAAQDIAGLGCNTPIYSANDGVVITARYNSSLGNYVEIDHGDGYETLYAHLSKSYVRVGQKVTMGDVIGAMGDTGFSFGCHLHFVTSYNGRTFDPMILYRS